MTDSSLTDADRAALVRNIMALGATTTERARALGYTHERTRQFERGLFPNVIRSFIRTGVILIAPLPQTDPPADVAGK